MKFKHLSDNVVLKHTAKKIQHKLRKCRPVLHYMQMILKTLSVRNIISKITGIYSKHSNNKYCKQNNKGEENRKEKFSQT